MPTAEKPARPTPAALQRDREARSYRQARRKARHRAGEIKTGVTPPAAKAGGKAEAFYVGAVYDALKKEVDRQKYIAQYNKNQPFTGRVNVVADKRPPYRTCREVLATAGQAELGEYKFMVMKNE